MSSHGHSGEGLTKPPLNALTSKQKDNCNARTGLKKPAAAAPSALVHLSIVGYARPRMRRKCAGILRRKGSIFSHIRRQCGYPVH
jgi:hypothetical protein